MTAKKILLLPGDGIGPEIMTQVRRVIARIERLYDLTFDVSEGLVGGCAYDAEGVPLGDDTLAMAKASDAIILGCVGGPKWDRNTAYEMRPEAGLLRLRKDLDLFANLRPVKCFDALVDVSSLKREVVAGLDLLFVRELAGGIYFGKPRGIEDLDDGGRIGFNTLHYTDTEIIRIARIAFEIARERSGKVHSAEKANVMEVGLLWREEVTKLHATDFSEVALEHILADNCAMQLVKAPRQFDVILTDNLFGDILSDAAAMLTGSLGMLPSASLGIAGPGLYEPVHGSAPDIAGRGVANPIAAILSFAMALRYSLDMSDAASKIEGAISSVLSAGIRTGDLASDGMTFVDTEGMGDGILNALG